MKGFKKPTTQASTPAASSTPKTERVAKSPVKLLQYKAAGEGEEFQLVCGLFAEVSKKKGTNYLTGCNTEEKVRFYVFTNKEGSKLVSSDYGTPNSPLVDVADLKEAASKKDPDMKFLVGKDSQGGSYFIFDRKQKE